MGDAKSAEEDGSLAARLFCFEVMMMLRFALPLCVLLVAGSASGQSNNLLNNPNGDEGLQSWRVFGNAAVSDCPGAGKCFSIFQDAFIFQDIAVSENAGGMFAVFISFASIENSGGPSTGPLGHPYLHGYFMNSVDLKKAAILANLSGQEMSRPPTENAAWIKQHGVFKVPEQAGAIRIFLARVVRKRPRRPPASVTFAMRASFFFQPKTRPKHSPTLISRSLT
jgi:hypothetical protein